MLNPMLKFIRRVCSNLVIRLGFLICLIMAIFGYSGGHFVFVKAYENRANIFPSSFLMQQEDEDLRWEETGNAFFQDLSRDASLIYFNKINSAFILSQASEDRVASSGLILEELDIFDKNYPEDEVMEIVPQQESEQKNQEGLIIEEDSQNNNQNTQTDAQEEISFWSGVKKLTSFYFKDIFDLGSVMASTSEEVIDKQDTENEGGKNTGLTETAETQGIAPLGEEQNNRNLDNRRDIGQSLIFRDFSVPFEEIDSEVGRINLRLSLAAKTDTASDYLDIQYNEGNKWKKLSNIKLESEISNNLNGDYFQIPLPEHITWKTIEDLQIKITYISENDKYQREAEIYLDALWLEVEYGGLAEGEKEEILQEEENEYLNKEDYIIDCKTDCIADCDETIKEESVLSEENKNQEDDNKKTKECVESCMDDCEAVGAEDGEQEPLYDFEIISGKKDFRIEESPEFDFQYKRHYGIVGKILSTVKGVFVDEYKDIEINALVRGFRMDKFNQNNLLVEYSGNGRFKVRISPDIRSFKPGRNKMEITIKDGDQVFNITQDFTWGVLAFNSNKSIYLPGEKAYLQLAVLDDDGNTLCRVRDLEIKIKTPEGRINYLGIDNGEIMASGECGPNNIIDVPDFYGFYEVGVPGIYEVNITALTDNGEREITDSFEVRELATEYLNDDNQKQTVYNVPFGIERTGPTRIYPIAPYRMTFNIKANVDYQGEFKEYIPDSFKLLSEEGIFMKQARNAKELSWSVDWQKGKNYIIDYIFDAPDVSPEFYLLGPAQAGDFKEYRKWQIASDAVDLEVLASKQQTGNPYSTTEETLASLSGFTNGDEYLIFGGVGSNRYYHAAGRCEVALSTQASETHLSNLEEATEGPAADDGSSMFLMGKRTWGSETLYLRGDAIGTGNCNADEVYLMGLNTDTMGTLNTDYFWNEYIFTDDIPDIAASRNVYASTTITADGTSEYLIIASMEIDVETVSQQVTMDIYNGSRIMVHNIRDTEDTADTLQMFVATTTVPAAGSMTFSVRVGGESGTTANHLSSRILVIRLDYYESHSCTGAKPGSAIGTSPIVYASTDLSLANAGDVVALYFGAFGSTAQGSGVSARARYDSTIQYQVTEDDLADGEGRNNVWLAGDIQPILWLYNIAVSDTNSHAYDFSFERQATVGATAEYALVCVWSEKAASFFEVMANEQYRSDGITTIPNGGWATNDVYLSALAQDVSSTTSFYFELIENGDTATTTTEEPENYCISGTAFSSCNSKIWLATTTYVSWYNTAWGYRKPLVINASRILSTENDFTILATTTDSDLAYTSYGGHMGLIGGGDIVITDSDGSTVLDYEREYYDPSTGQIILWIEADISSTTNKTLYMYYGNSGATDQSSATGAWDANHVTVHHFDESPADAVAGHIDSTAGGYNGTPYNFSDGGGGTTDAAGRFDGADDYAGDDDYVSIGLPTVFNNIPVNDFTVSMWMYPHSVAGAATWIRAMDIRYDSSNFAQFTFHDSDGELNFRVQDAGTQRESGVTNPITANNWYYVVGSWDASANTLYFYLNGVLQSGAYGGTAGAGSLQAINLGRRSDGNAATYFNGIIDEFRVSNTLRSSSWIMTTYNNLSSVDSFVSIGGEVSEEGAREGLVNITAIPDSDTGYKWQVVGFSGGWATSWGGFNVTTPNFQVDGTPPDAPGPLTERSKTSSNVSLNFGYASSDDHFDQYKIFYKQGASGVTESDTEFNKDDDFNLDYVNYGGAGYTTITGLSPNTTYTFNIWAYDLAGNSTPADTEVTITMTDANHNLASFNFNLAETDIDINNAYIIFEAQFEAYSDYAANHTGYNLAFDVCAEPCTANAFLGSGRVLKDDSATLSYAEGESNQIRLLFDVTDEAQLAAYGGEGGNMEAQVGYMIETGTLESSIASVRTQLVITYTYDDDSKSFTNTVIYPLESNYSGDSGTRRAMQSDDCTLDSDCPTFSYNIDLPEFITSSGPSRISQWFRIYDLNDSNGTNDILADINIEGTDIDSNIFYHDAELGQSQGNMPEMLFSSVSGFLENTEQDLEVHSHSPDAAVDQYLIGGEVLETYTASTSVYEKTRTINLPLGVLNNGLTAANSMGSVNVYFPENGIQSGNITIKKAWFRIIGIDHNSGAKTKTIASRVGNNATSSAYVYNYNVTGTVIKPSFNIIHVIPSSDYDELETANAQTPVAVRLSSQNSDSTNTGGTSAELMITYSYISENKGYLSSLKLFAGQQETDGNATSAVLSVYPTIFPEASGKTVLSGGLLAHYALSDSDGSMPSSFFTIDANIGVSSPVCTNAYNTRGDSFNSFSDFYKNITSSLTTTNNQTYLACYSNTNSGDTSAGAKMGGQLFYTYKYVNPLTISVEADNQYKSDGFTAVANGGWTKEEQINLAALVQESATSTNQVDFYFELIANSDTATTSLSEPTNACSSGTAFGSCGSKIWTVSANTSAPWYDYDWDYRQKLTINAVQVVSTESGFPVLATTSSDNLKHTSHGGNVALSSGYDLVVTDSDGVTVLNYEREYYSSTTGEMVFWIKADISSTTNKDLYLYYGNSGATDQSTTTGVWDANHVTVHHFDESPADAVAGHIDSTAGGYNGTPYNFSDGGGGTTDAAGRFDGADDYAGDDDYVSIGLPTVFNNIPVNDFTVSMWMYPHSVAGAATWIRAMDIRYDSSNFAQFTFHDSDGELNFRVQDAGTQRESGVTNPITANNWYYVVGSWDASANTLYFYLNGVLQSGAYGGTAGAGSLQAINLGRRSDGNAATYFNGIIDEFRVSNTLPSSSWIKTTYNNQSNLKDFISFSSQEISSSQSYEGIVNITSIPDSSEGYKWRVMACNDGNDCTKWDVFGATPNFRVDNTLPTAPGNLTLATTTPTSVTLYFGTSTTEVNFAGYKIFYKKGIAGVDIGDTEQIDANLSYIDYNGATTTTIFGLEPSTQYVFNIWAYDAVNKTGAIEIQVTTADTAHARARSVQFFAGSFSGDGTTGKLSDTDQNFSSFNFKLAEKEAEIRDAYIIFEVQFESYADNIGNYTGYNLAFDSCEEPCTADAFSGSGIVLKDDNSVLAYDETESNQVRILFDVKDETQLSIYTGDSVNMEAQVGYRIERGAAVNSISAAKAVLVITYAFNDDDSSNFTNTVIYPLESAVSGDSGSRQASQAGGCTRNSNCPEFNYNMVVPEVGEKLDQWFQVYGINDGNGISDIEIDVNIQTQDVNSDVYIHESANDTDQGNLPMIIFGNVYGFTENTNQVLEHYTSIGTHYLVGGEVFETYTALKSASTKTRTVSFPLGVITNGQTTSIASGSVNVYFPENGVGSGVVDIKKAWFRIVSNNYNTGAYNMIVSSKVGDNAQSGNYVYNMDAGTIVIKPSLHIIHVIPSTNYSELELANKDSSKKVVLYTTNSSVNIGGVSAELMITYTYSSEVTGYLTSLDLYGGQPENAANTQSAVLSTAKSVFPELRGSETVRASALIPSYLITDDDANLPGVWFTAGVNISTTSPVCTNAFYLHPDSVNGFFEYIRNVTSSILNTDKQSYTACYSNTNTGPGSDTSAGAKMNAIWRYTYQWDSVPPDFTQSDWRWYVNIDNKQPTTALAAENTAISNINIGDILRVRMNIGVTQEDMPASTQVFKLQYGKGSDCTAISSWLDVGAVGGSAPWIGYNNPDPIDSATLTTTLLQYSTVAQTYEESNPTASNPNTVINGGFGEWDWTLYNNGASSTAIYCFRFVKSDGTSLYDYLTDGYPNLITAASNTKPSLASNLKQTRSDGLTNITNGGWINEKNVLLTARATDPNISETIALYFQLVTSTSTFTTSTSTPTGACVYGTAYNSCPSKVWFVAPGSPDDYRVSPYIGTTSITNIPDNSLGYKWQVLSCDDSSACANHWVAPGASPNFKVDTVDPSPPGNLSFYSASTTVIILNFGASTVESNFSKYRIFYRAGIAGVRESDTEHTDNNLNYKNYNGAGSTTIINLSAGTEYVFNIWAYDYAGNKASATIEAVGTTTESFNPPTGSIVSAVQKANGSGTVDLAILVDDIDNNFSGTKLCFL